MYICWNFFFVILNCNRIVFMQCDIDFGVEFGEMFVDSVVYNFLY